MTRWRLRPDSVFLDPPGELVPGLVVLVEDRTIIFAGPEAEAGATCPLEHFVPLPLPGLNLFPGLLNTHVHLSFNGTTDTRAAYLAEPPGTRVIRAVVNAQTLLRSGVTTARDCG